MSLSPTDRATLDALYNLRAAVPEHPAYFERYAASSAAFRARLPGRLDLPYGDSARQAIDLFLPQAASPPLLVFIHGGYWQALDRKDFSFVAEPLVEAGAAVALVGYDLAPTVDMDAIVDQVRQAIAWLHRHAGAHGYDGGRICLAGHSAGGHLAAMALATDWTDHGLPADVVKGVCAISGVFDLEPIRQCYLNQVVGLDEAQARRHSPVVLPPQARCPVMLTVGEHETAAFHRQSRAFADALSRHGVPCELVTQPGHDHFSIIMAIAFLLDGIDDPTIVWPYAEENDNSLYSRNYNVRDLSFMTKRGHGRHYMARTEACLASNPETALARRLRQALAEFGLGEPPMIDEYSGGNMSCFFLARDEKGN